MDDWNTLLIEMIEESLQSNGWARFRVISNSMQPLIRKDDWVHAVGLSSSEDLHFGEIVLFRRNSNMIMHRVIQLNNGNVITKGDSCMSFDEPVLREDVLASVTQLQRGNRMINLKSFPGKVLGFVLTISTLMVAVCNLCYRKIFHNDMEIV